MHAPSRWVLGFALAGVALLPCLVTSDASGQPVGGLARSEPGIVRVEVEGLEAIRGVRFVGPIVQAVRPADAREKASAPAGSGAPYWTNWNNDSLSIAGTLPAPAGLSAWLDSSLDGRLATKTVSVVALDTFARELWRWRFVDCAPLQMAYDVDAGTWTMRLAFARMRYQIASVEPETTALPRPDDRPASASLAFVRVTLAKGAMLEASRLEANEADGQLAVTTRTGGRIVIPWADVKSVEAAADAPPR